MLALNLSAVRWMLLVCIRGATLVTLIQPHMAPTKRIASVLILQHPLADPYLFKHERLAKGLLTLKHLAPLSCYVPATLDFSFRPKAESVSNSAPLVAAALIRLALPSSFAMSDTYKTIFEVVGRRRDLLSQQDQLRALCLSTHTCLGREKSRYKKQTSQR